MADRGKSRHGYVDLMFDFIKTTFSTARMKRQLQAYI